MSSAILRRASGASALRFDDAPSARRPFGNLVLVAAICRGRSTLNGHVWMLRSDVRSVTCEVFVLVW